jgi:23S rRNA (cytidine1920-2'-O)/16S rRNA (cytidine1409-2'-O)-methyltransferase
VGKGGVVRDPAAHQAAIAGVIAATHGGGWRALQVVASPITGAAGNHEYLLWLQRRSASAPGSGEGAEAPALAGLGALVARTLASPDGPPLGTSAH